MYSYAILKFRGYNIGCRLIDEFLAKAETRTCRSVQEVAENIAKVLFSFEMLMMVASLSYVPWSECRNRTPLKPGKVIVF